jgi:hypothetical protein
MLKDILGNALKAGDFIHIQLPSNMVLAKITEVNDGGLLRASRIIANSRINAMQIPGSVQFIVEIGTNFDPKNPVLNCNKAVIPHDSPLLKKDKDAKPKRSKCKTQ